VRQSIDVYASPIFSVSPVSPVVKAFDSSLNAEIQRIEAQYNDGYFQRTTPGAPDYSQEDS